MATRTNFKSAGASQPRKVTASVTITGACTMKAA